MTLTNLPAKMSPAEWAERDEWFRNGFHWCSKCKQKLALLNFSKTKRSRYGYYNWCKQCQSRSRKGNIQIQRKAKRHDRELKSYYKDLMGRKCVKCGYSKAQVSLEFHHINPDDKEFNPSDLISSGNHLRIMAELDKCILLCRNCHQEFGSSVWSAEFIKVELGWAIKKGTVAERKNEYWTIVSDKILFDQSSLFDITPNGIIRNGQSTITIGVDCDYPNTYRGIEIYKDKTLVIKRFDTGSFDVDILAAKGYIDSVGGVAVYDSSVEGFRVAAGDE